MAVSISIIVLYDYHSVFPVTRSSTALEICFHLKEAWNIHEVGRFLYCYYLFVLFLHTCIHTYIQHTPTHLSMHNKLMYVALSHPLCAAQASLSTPHLPCSGADAGRGARPSEPVPVLPGPRWAAAAHVRVSNGLACLLAPGGVHRSADRELIGRGNHLKLVIINAFIQTLNTYIHTTTTTHHYYTSTTTTTTSTATTTITKYHLHFSTTEPAPFSSGAGAAAQTRPLLLRRGGDSLPTAASRATAARERCRRRGHRRAGQEGNAGDPLQNE